ncbi:hypothetical protein EMPG_10050 [Blastomyces silverae]|uniref:Uncharacterized protein n=1 Tax=Blastomyces silverae TaxID=2060906 RepID=A0A0H1B6C3_9EURO|nr:hypothetical protein EMPG_10050 [Blastomyces silverae]
MNRQSLSGSTLPSNQSNDAASIITLPEYTESENRPPSPTPTYHTIEEQHHGQHEQLSTYIKGSPVQPNPRLLDTPAPLLVHPYRAKFPPISGPPGSIYHLPQPANVDLTKALHSAAKGADENAVRHLIDHGVFVDSREEGTAFTALHQTAMRGYLAITSFLLERGADPQAKNDQGQTALHLAARNGMVSVVQLLLDQGALVNAASHNGKTALHKAAKGNRLATVELLLDHGADVNTLNDFFMTPVDVAATQRNSGPVVGLLLKRGADVKNDYVSKALHYAIRRAEAAIVSLLLEHGARKKPYSGWSALRAAVVSGSIAIIGTLLDHGANIEETDESGRTALRQAAVSGKALVIQYLLERGADANARGVNGNSAVELASIYGHEKAYEILEKARNKTISRTFRESPSPYIGRDPAPGFVSIFACENYTSEEAYDKLTIQAEAGFLRSNVLDLCMWRNQAEIYMFKATYCDSCGYRPWRDIEKAIQIYCDALELRSDTRAGFWIPLGHLYMKAGYLDSAIRVFERVADAYERMRGYSTSLLPEVFIDVGQAYLARRDHVNAISAYRKYIAAASRTGERPHYGWKLIGDACMDKDSPNEAISAYETAVQALRGVNDTAIWKSLGDAYVAAGKPEPADRAYTEYRRVV